MKNLILILVVIGALAVTAVLSSLMMKGFRLVDEIQQAGAQGGQGGGASQIPGGTGQPMPDAESVSKQEKDKVEPQQGYGLII